MSQEVVEVIEEQPSPYSKWPPRQGRNTLALLERVFPDDNSARERLAQEATSVLSCCVPPTQAEGVDTGLVIGYVQSGKTANFTTIAALAADNGYKLVIVISGVVKNLFNQSCERLRNDLGVTEGNRGWLYLQNPTRARDATSLRAALNSRPLAGIEQRTTLIVVLKHTSHIRNLTTLLEGLADQAIPTLIIDDEADQASLNNRVRQGDVSATYLSISRLRATLPQHTFLQFTATPQAPLLISILDVLSPSFVELLTPGEAYAGGQTFFEDQRQARLIREIPPNDIATNNNPLTSPPRSLLSALEFFYLGVAVGIQKGEQAYKNRSMLVHPAKDTASHAQYARWIQSTQDEWRRILDAAETDLDRQERLASFQRAFDDLLLTGMDSPPFLDLVPYIQSALAITQVCQVNSTPANVEPQWRQEYSWIVVGGDKINRGYTVEGLTVTYMPRGIGGSNADTIQQRARWFGYKASYLGFCRVYLTQDVRQAYVDYVEHEESVRRALHQHRQQGLSVRDWKRLFLLSANLRPTRDQVIDSPYFRGGQPNTWFKVAAPHHDEQTTEANRVAVAKLLGGLQMQDLTGDTRRTEMQTPKVDRASLRELLDGFFTELTWPDPGDALQFNGILFQLGNYLDTHDDEDAVVFEMGQGKSRVRPIDAAGHITSNLHQGENPPSRTAKLGEIYPGDAEIRQADTLSVQIHWLDLERSGSTVARRVPALAIWIPRRLARSWLAQDQ